MKISVEHFRTEMGILKKNLMTILFSRNDSSTLSVLLFPKLTKKATRGAVRLYDLSWSRTKQFA